jgi:tRNA threonylcarbamoyladenosine biosynthesis protein TsaB
MLTLALETATEHASAALVEDGRELAGWREVTHQDLLRRLAEEVRRVLATAGRQFSDLSLVAVGLGPGSFTSLRVGLATAKGICLARAVPLVGVPSLAAMVWPVRDRVSGLICPVLDARRGEVYAGLFRVAGEGVVRVQSEFVATAAVLAEKLRAGGGPVTLLGQAELPPVQEALQSLGRQAAVLGGAAVWPDAGAVAALGRQAFAARGEDDPDSLRPIYVRKSYAEESSNIDLGLR